MAIAPTGAIYKSLIFDGEDSRDYGVYISGEAVYNAPERDVEMVAIPGRNGAFALDKGRFENIEVIYPAGIFADNETDFAEAISDFRNFLCSRNGYVRLEDEYNPNEYRMAIYKSGLEVSPTQLKTGEFEIIFECKPQRWLKSGEEAITVGEGGAILRNPTLFEARPLISVKGYGGIVLNGYDISLNNDIVGHVVLLGANPTLQPFGTGEWTSRVALQNTKLINTSDDVVFGGVTLRRTITFQSGSAGSLSVVVTDNNPDYYTSTATVSGNTITIDTILSAGSFQYESRFIDLRNVVNLTVGTYRVNYTYRVMALGEWLTFNQSNISNTTDFSDGVTLLSYGEISANSTQSILGNPTYIDCDLGEAYKMVSGEAVSLNQYIYLGSELPVLAGGGGSVARYEDDTITEFKVTPRWWKV